MPLSLIEAILATMVPTPVPTLVATIVSTLEPEIVLGILESFLVGGTTERGDFRAPAIMQQAEGQYNATAQRPRPALL